MASNRCEPDTTFLRRDNFRYIQPYDRKIGKTDAEMPEIEETPKLQIKTANSGDFELIPRKIRKQGTGCVFQINENLWEGSYFPRLPNGKRKKFNVYARTRDECEKLLAEMIECVKIEIAEMKQL